MINKIISAIRNEPTNKKFLISEIEKIFSNIPQDFGGGCSIQKALLMSLIISEFKLEKTVDLGVYRGRSLLPQALAHKLYSGGNVFGVDPYSNTAAVQNDRPDLKNELEEFAEVTDFNEIYNEVQSLIQRNEFANNCQLIREKSSDATEFFTSNNHQLDLVHVDGNHDTKFVMEDVNNYLPLLKEKGFIVLDDISWDSVQPAYLFLDNKMNCIDKLVSEGNDFALFAKGLNEIETKKIRKIFTIIKSVTSKE